MRHLFRLILLLLPLCCGAQRLDTTYYTYPLKGVAGYLSANFGEMRTNHFHSGIDFKTDGREGKSVVAVADGYVSRVFYSHSGYGRALYVEHPNGTTSVYGHLQRFSPAIERWVQQERRRLGRSRVDLYCDSTRFRVKKGEEIARSGNSGTSYGPHLHFEIRDSRTQQTLNGIAEGIVKVKDQIPPYLFRLHYVEVDTLQGVPVQAPLRTYEVERRDRSHYQLKGVEQLPVGRNGYLILEASDRKEEVSNTFGIYRLRGFLDTVCFFEYRMAGFRFDQTRYCNAVSYYPLQLNSRNEVLRMALVEGGIADFYPTLLNRGAISLAAGERRALRIEVEDDCGNRSSLAIPLLGKEEEQCFRASADTLRQVVDRRQNFHHEEEGLQVMIPHGSLYESLFYRQQCHPNTLKGDTTLIYLSPRYEILDRTIPLHKAISVGIQCFVPQELQERVTLASRNNKGRITCLGGKYEAGVVRGQIRSLGEVFVVADTVAPRLEPRFQSGSDLKGASMLRFRWSDNFSGVASWNAFLDGEWQPLDYHPIQGVATLSLERLEPRQELHTVTIRLVDGCGNQTDWSGTFVY